MKEEISFLRVLGQPYVGDLFRGAPERAGYDILQHEDFICSPLRLTKVTTDVRFPEGLGNYFALLTLRSSYQGTGLMMPAVGVIDGDYTDYIFYTLYNESLHEVQVKDGDRVVQLVFMRLEK